MQLVLEEWLVSVTHGDLLFYGRYVKKNKIALKSPLINHLATIPLRKETLYPSSIKPHPMDIAEPERTSTPLADR